jgi:hypothetical protein
MTMFLVLLAFAAGYVASIYSWPRVKLRMNGAKVEIAGLEARAVALKAML